MYASGGGRRSQLTITNEYTGPSFPPESAAFAVRYPASKRRWNPICSRPFVRAACATTSFVSASPIATGFSQNVAIPASRQRRMIGACVSVGVTITAASTPSSAASMLSTCLAPTFAATSRARAASAS